MAAVLKPSLRGLFFAIVFVFSLFGTNPALAGAWTQKKGETLLIQNVTFYQADHFFNQNGDRQSQAEFTKIELNPYMEYGWTDDLTLGSNLSLQNLDQENVSTIDATPGDAEFFARYRLFHEDDLTFSLQPLIKLPAFYDEEDPLAPGAGQWDVELMSQVAYDFSILNSPKHHFISIDLGYRWRSGQPSNEVRLDMGLGVRANENWMVILQSFNRYSTITNGTTTFSNSAVRDYRSEKIQLSVVGPELYGFTPQIGVFEDLRGVNSSEGKGVLVSLWKRF